MIDIHNVQTLATILLVGRIVAVTLVARVILKQIVLLRRNQPPEIQRTRIILLGFATAVLLNNFIPILVDIIGTFDSHIKSSASHVKTIGVIYTLSNMVMSIIISAFFTYLYKDDDTGTTFEIRKSK